jgi:ribonuclease Z
MLNRLGLSTGPWLNDFKRYIYMRKDPDILISVPAPATKTGTKTFRLGPLADELAVISKGQKISYISDVAYNPANMAKIRRLADNSDHLFIEAAFLDADRSHALQKKHLTARQAGEIAGLANAKRFTLFHFSPRYEGNEPAHAFYAEANAAYQAAINKEKRS